MRGFHDVPSCLALHRKRRSGWEPPFEERASSGGSGREPTSVDFTPHTWKMRMMRMPSHFLPSRINTSKGQKVSIFPIFLAVRMYSICCCILSCLVRCLHGICVFVQDTDQTSTVHQVRIPPVMKKPTGNVFLKPRSWILMRLTSYSLSLGFLWFHSLSLIIFPLFEQESEASDGEVKKKKAKVMESDEEVGNASSGKNASDSESSAWMQLLSHW